MTAETQNAEEGVVIADGIDEEPVESNRRLFTGRSLALVALFATLYSAFHMANLNGLSIRSWTGGAVDLPFLPRFPLETWNFRILHIAGALGLGFLIFAPFSFGEAERRHRSAGRPTRFLSRS